MAIKFERDKNGNIVAIDTETNKKVGGVSAMGDILEKEKEGEKT